MMSNQDDDYYARLATVAEASGSRSKRYSIIRDAQAQEFDRQQNPSVSDTKRKSYDGDAGYSFGMDHSYSVNRSGAAENAKIYPNGASLGRRAPRTSIQAEEFAYPYENYQGSHTKENTRYNQNYMMDSKNNEGSVNQNAIYAFQNTNQDFEPYVMQKGYDDDRDELEDQHLTYNQEGPTNTYLPIGARSRGGPNEEATRSLLTVNHVWSIQKFREFSGDKVISMPFGFENWQWVLILYPSGAGRGQGSHVSAFVRPIKSVMDISCGSNWRRSMHRFELRIRCHKTDTESKNSRNDYVVTAASHPGFKEFSDLNDGWGFPRLMPIDDLRDAINPSDGSIVVELSIIGDYSSEWFVASSYWNIGLEISDILSAVDSAKMSDNSDINIESISTKSDNFGPSEAPWHIQLVPKATDNGSFCSLSVFIGRCPPNDKSVINWPRYVASLAVRVFLDRSSGEREILVSKSLATGMIVSEESPLCGWTNLIQLDDVKKIVRKGGYTSKMPVTVYAEVVWKPISGLEKLYVDYVEDLVVNLINTGNSLKEELERTLLAKEQVEKRVRLTLDAQAKEVLESKEKENMADDTSVELYKRNFEEACKRIASLEEKIYALEELRLQTARYKGSIESIKNSIKDYLVPQPQSVHKEQDSHTVSSLRRDNKILSAKLAGTESELLQLRDTLNEIRKSRQPLHIDVTSDRWFTNLNPEKLDAKAETDAPLSPKSTVKSVRRDTLYARGLLLEIENGVMKSSFVTPKELSNFFAKISIIQAELEVARASLVSLACDMYDDPDPSTATESLDTIMKDAQWLQDEIEDVRSLVCSLYESVNRIYKNTPEFDECCKSSKYNMENAMYFDLDAIPQHYCNPNAHNYSNPGSNHYHTQYELPKLAIYNRDTQSMVERDNAADGVTGHHRKAVQKSEGHFNRSRQPSYGTECSMDPTLVPKHFNASGVIKSSSSSIKHKKSSSRSQHRKESEPSERTQAQPKSPVRRSSRHGSVSQTQLSPLEHHRPSAPESAVVAASNLLLPTAPEPETQHQEPKNVDNNPKELGIEVHDKIPETVTPQKSSSVCAPIAENRDSNVSSQTKNKTKKKSLVLPFIRHLITLLMAYILYCVAFIYCDVNSEFAMAPHMPLTCRKAITPTWRVFANAVHYSAEFTVSNVLSFVRNPDVHDSDETTDMAHEDPSDNPYKNQDSNELWDYEDDERYKLDNSVNHDVANEPPRLHHSFHVRNSPKMKDQSQLPPSMHGNDTTVVDKNEQNKNGHHHKGPKSRDPVYHNYDYPASEDDVLYANDTHNWSPEPNRVNTSSEEENRNEYHSPSFNHNPQSFAGSGEDVFESPHRTTHTPDHNMLITNNTTQAYHQTPNTSTSNDPAPSKQHHMLPSEHSDSTIFTHTTVNTEHPIKNAESSIQDLPTEKTEYSVREPPSTAIPQASNTHTPINKTEELLSTVNPTNHTRDMQSAEPVRSNIQQPVPVLSNRTPLAPDNSSLPTLTVPEASSTVSSPPNAHTTTLVESLPTSQPDEPRAYNGNSDYSGTRFVTGEPHVDNLVTAPPNPPLELILGDDHLHDEHIYNANNTDDHPTPARIYIPGNRFDQAPDQLKLDGNFKPHAAPSPRHSHSGQNAKVSPPNVRMDIKHHSAHNKNLEQNGMAHEQQIVNPVPHKLPS